MLRLSNALASETGAITLLLLMELIMLHVRENNTFLNTLIPPESARKRLLSYSWATYPSVCSISRLVSRCQRVLKIDVPRIGEDDIRQLYDDANIKIPKDSTEAAIKLINKTVEGNTLSAVFAIHEARQCCSIEELEQLLECKQLSSGVSAYYEYI